MYIKIAISKISNPVSKKLLVMEKAIVKLQETIDLQFSLQLLQWSI
jgi:hypothetical protein